MEEELFFIKRHTITLNNCTESNIYAGAIFLCVGFMCKGKLPKCFILKYMTTNVYGLNISYLLFPFMLGNLISFFTIGLYLCHTLTLTYQHIFELLGMLPI